MMPGHVDDMPVSRHVDRVVGNFVVVYRASVACGLNGAGVVVHFVANVYTFIRDGRGMGTQQGTSLVWWVDDEGKAG